MPYDHQAKQLIEEANKKYQDGLFEMFLANSKEKKSAIKNRILQECQEWSQKVPDRYKPICLLPGQLLIEA